MKTRLLTLALLLCAVFTAKAQYVTIPDANFVAWLNNNGYSQCLNGNQLDTTCNAVTTAFTVNCYNSNISSIEGIQYFDNLYTLGCFENNLTSLPTLPLSLNTLQCQQNNISTMPTLPPGLVVLNCSANNLTTLPAIPSTMGDLRYGANHFTAFVPVPDNLLNLDCSLNNISSISNLPSNLSYFSCANNPINTLPNLPSRLYDFDCNNCNLNGLPALPDSLRVLWCEHNSITNLPALPPFLIDLTCSFNQLSSLPSLPATLTWLSCDNNSITQIPTIGTELRNLVCNNNQLTYISAIPDTMTILYCHQNPNLTCLPRIGVLNTLFFSGTSVECLPSQAQIGTADQQLSLFPVCDIFNTNGCPAYSNVSGYVYVDLDSDCNLDNVDVKQNNILVNLWNGNNLVEQSNTNESGFYSFSTTSLEVRINLDTTGLPFSISCPVSGELLDTLSPLDASHINRNFALRCKTGFDLAAHSVSAAGVFRPANNTVVNIHAGDLANFYNANCALGVAGTVMVTINGPATYLLPAQGANAPSNVAGNALTYNVADFGTADALHDFNIIVQTDTFAQAGQQVCFTVRVTPTTGDNYTTNNTLTHCFNIVNSYDPNDKTAYPAGDIDTTQEWLTYTVRFQNTGNAEAQHIYIMDTLENDLDVATFQLLAYSHQPNVQIKENVVRFNFPNINLPDSFSNEPGSHGYVQYKVKLKANLPIGTTIENTAFIYFDFNPPVVTNTATNTITEVQDTTIIGIKPIAKAFDINIYPNPANNQVTVTAGQAGNTIYMYTAQGKLIATQNMGGTAETLNIAELPGGIYYIEVAGKAGTARKKMVKF